MTALPQLPVSPADVVDANEAEQIADVIQLNAYKSVPGTAEDPGVEIPLLLGVAVTTTLLRNQQWDNFWIRQGERLNNVWHGVFGSQPQGGYVTQVQQRLAIQLSQHISARMMRQLSAQWMGKIAGLSNLVVRGLKASAAGIRSLQGQLGQLRQAMNGAILRAIATAEAYTDRRVAALWTRVLQDQAQQNKDLLRWVSQHAITPLEENLGRMNHDLQQFKAWTVKTAIPQLERDIQSRTAKEAATVAAIAAAVARLTKEQEDCTEPMCETVGPKTDWGKLFKKFGPAGLLALLALWEHEDPAAVADAARHLADVLGPVLEEWTRAWWGLGGGDTGPAEKAVEHEAGSGPLV